MAVELKNMNLGYRWNRAWVFDRDVMRRFLKVDTSKVSNLLGMKNWETNSRNSFPKATKILIQPSFGFTAKAWKTPHSRKRIGPEEVKLLNEKKKAGLIPPSNSETDKILWRINRLNLIVYQLGYELKPGEHLPEDIQTKLSKALILWLKQSLKRNFGRTKLPRQTPLPMYYSQNDPIIQGSTSGRDLWDHLE
jgi:hypothetical protein